jgi:RND family efflux transporter MFP subunit
MLLALPLAANAGDLIPITPKQLQSMGIAVASLAQAQPVMSDRLPGEITVPVGQERVVSAPQSGLLDAVQAAAGQNVKRGQVLAHINSPDLVGLQRDYLQAQTQQRLEANMLERDRELYKEGIIAERRLLTTQSNHEELSINLAQRRQALKLAGMSDDAIRKLETSGTLSSGLSLTAPIDGVVLEQMATAGQRVDTGTPIYRIARLKPLWLEIHAPLDILDFVKVGMRMTIPNYDAEGKIITILRNVNKNDQTVHLRAEIVSGAEKLSPGQFVEASLMSDATHNEFTVPKGAVVRSGQKSFIFVQNAKGFSAEPVTLVREQASGAVIKGEQLSGSEKVAVSGTAALKAVWSGIGGE